MKKDWMDRLINTLLAVLIFGVIILIALVIVNLWLIMPLGQ